jgi:hypothetical protein
MHSPYHGVKHRDSLAAYVVTYPIEMVKDGFMVVSVTSVDELVSERVGSGIAASLDGAEWGPGSRDSLIQQSNPC